MFSTTFSLIITSFNFCLIEEIPEINLLTKIVIFLIRHEKKVESNTPAPNAYNTSGLNPRGIF